MNKWNQLDLNPSIKWEELLSKFIYFKNIKIFKFTESRIPKIISKRDLNR